MRHAAALAFLLALTVAYYWKLTFATGYTWLENPDQALQVRPWLDYQARELHAGRLPLWDPYQWGGQTLIGQMQPGLANPLNWILYAMPLREGHIPLGVLHWYWVLIHWVAAACCYWLCRDLGAGLAASVLGASIFSFAGYIGLAGTPQFLMSAVFSPLVFLFFARVFRGDRPVASAALCGASLGAMFLGGHHNVPIYTTVLLGGLWIWYLATHKHRVRPLLAFLVLCGLVSAVQMLPAIEYGRQAVRWSGTPEPQRWHDRIPYSVHAEYSLHWRSIPGMVIPGLSVHASPFVGITALVLAFTAIRRRWRSREVQIMAAVALGGLLLALGKDTPVHRLAYTLIPMVEKARYPAMAVVLSQVGIAALAALGLDAAIATRRSWSPLWLGLSLCGSAVVLALVTRVPIDRFLWILPAVALVLAGALYWGRCAAVVALALFFAEALTYPPPIQRRNQPGSFLQAIDDQADIAEFLQRQPGWFRIEVDEDAVPYNFGDFHGIEQFGGYTASMLDRVHRVVGGPETPRMFGIQYRVARLPKPGQVEVFSSRSGLKVFRDPRIGEPLWTFHSVPCAGEDRLRVVRRAPDAMVIEAELACLGLVVTGDPYYRGWRAWVDGRREPIQEFAGVVRALPANAGRRRIEFRYRPGSMYWGAGLTLLGLLLAARAAVR